MATRTATLKSKLMRLIKEDLEYRCAASPEQLRAAIAEHTDQGPLQLRLASFSGPSKPLRGSVGPKLIEVSIVPEGRNSFTPYIKAQIEPDGAAGARLVGTYGPNQLVLAFLAMWGMMAGSFASILTLAALFDPNGPPLLVMGIFPIALGFPLLLLTLGKMMSEDKLHQTMNDITAYAEFLASEAPTSGVTFDHQHAQEQSAPSGAQRDAKRR
jgi:hypothetical protein